LEAQEYLEEALKISPDSEQKFDIALKLNNFDVAREIALKDNTEHKWKSLGDLALSSFKYKLAIEAFKNANDLESLLLLYTSFNQKSKLGELATTAKSKGKYNVAFNAYWTAGDISNAVELLQLSDRSVEASFLAVTYGADSSKSIEEWKSSLQKINKSGLADRISVPGVDEGFPLKKDTQNLVDLDDDENSVAEEAPSTAESTEAAAASEASEDEVLEDVVEDLAEDVVV
jgi:coatomer subunit beta'